MFCYCFLYRKVSPPTLRSLGLHQPYNGMASKISSTAFSKAEQPAPPPTHQQLLVLPHQERGHPWGGKEVGLSQWRTLFFNRRFVSSQHCCYFFLCRFNLCVEGSPHSSLIKFQRMGGGGVEGGRRVGKRHRAHQVPWHEQQIQLCFSDSFCSFPWQMGRFLGD